MVEGKQVKVDNWGIFFLQRLHQFYNKTFFCDLTLQFEDNVQIKVHRLVMNACTEYFQMLENKCEMEKDCLLMPSNLPSDVVLPIINFMYSGILEFHESLFDRLYATAKLMNMSVLTKLLDAQKTPIKPITPLPKRVQSVTPITWNLQGKKIMTKNFSEPELPETLPGRKLPIWKRKSVPSTVSYVSANSSSFDSYSPKLIKSEEPPKPTRFEWPEEEDGNFDNSFDEISYASKPLILPSVTLPKEKSPKPSTSAFDEIKKSGPVKRSASPIGNQCKKVNIQDVKEYVKEHKIRSDFIDYDDSETTDNDLQTYDNDDSAEECSKDASDMFTQITEETPNKSILKTDSSTPSNKHVRFSLEGKDVKKQQKSPKEPTVDMSKHTKIITEVLKKYPHLVKNNKNIRLKILAKGNNSPAKVTTKTALTPPKPTSKVSYMVMKPEIKSTSSSDKDNKNNELGSWECTRCEEPKQFKSYHLYRQHLTEAHNEKQDSQMCILCGHISRKQNMLVYHKYIKHNVPPPAMYNFPKCKDCNYIALSQALLNKHQLNHTLVNLTCSQCDTIFQNKQLFLTHIQQTGHSQEKSVTPPYSCNFCDKRFFSENILNTHIKKSHEKEMKSEIKTEEPTTSKTKDKIKILSDVKVNASVPNSLVPVRMGDINSVKQEAVNPEPLEPSSEAEALSNVASGIAASLGLVDTIVVLDDNQFILQSTQGNIQENILNNTGQEYIIPEMHMADLSAIANTQVTQTVTDTNTALTQTTTKPNITSTDELVMVLTDHDYSDAVNNTVITDNNIVVLYSHPVQTQAMMINSETGLIEVNKNYAVTSEIPEQVVNCEESIEMIQQEINNQLEEATVVEQNIEYAHPSEFQQETNVEFVQNPENVEYQQENIDPQDYQVQRNDNLENANIQNKPTHMEESIELIQDEINKLPEGELIKETVNEEIKNTEMQVTEVEEVITQNVSNNLPPNQEVPENHIEINTDIELLQNDNTYIVERNDFHQTHVENLKENNLPEEKTEQEVPQIDLESKEQNIEPIFVTENVGNMENITQDITMQVAQEMESQQINMPEMEVQQMDIQQTENQQLDIAQMEAQELHIPQMESQQLDISQIEDQQLDISQMEGQQLDIPQMEGQQLDIPHMESQEMDIPQMENQQMIVEAPPEVQQIDNIDPTSEHVPNSEENQQINIGQDIQLNVTEENIQDVKIDRNIQQMDNEQMNIIEDENQTVSQNITQESNPHLPGDVQELNDEELNMSSENIQEMDIHSESIEQVDNQESIPQLENEVGTEIKNDETNNTQIEHQQLNIEQQMETEKMETDQLENQQIDTQQMDEQVQMEIPETQSEIVETTEKIDSPSVSSQNSPELNEENSIDSDEKNEETKKLNAALQNEKISQLLNDWDDGDTDSQQSYSKTVTPVAPNNSSSINKLIDDWEDEEDT